LEQNALGETSKVDERGFMAWNRIKGHEIAGINCVKCGHTIPAAYSIIKHFDAADNIQRIDMLCSPCTTLLEQWLGGKH
jgi:hypothetical protein